MFKNTSMFKIKEISFKVLILTTQYITHIPIEILFDSLIKGPTNMVKVRVVVIYSQSQRDVGMVVNHNNHQR